MDKEAIKTEFHNLNNLLNKISVRAGQARFELDQKGLNKDNLDEEKKKYTVLFDEIEEQAVSIGRLLKEIKNNIL